MYPWVWLKIKIRITSKVEVSKICQWSWKIREGNNIVQILEYNPCKHKSSETKKRISTIRKLRDLSVQISKKWWTPRRTGRENGCHIEPQNSLALHMADIENTAFKDTYNSSNEKKVFPNWVHLLTSPPIFKDVSSFVRRSIRFYNDQHRWHIPSRPWPPPPISTLITSPLHPNPLPPSQPHTTTPRIQTLSLP